MKSDIFPIPSLRSIVVSWVLSYKAHYAAEKKKETEAHKCSLSSMQLHACTTHTCMCTRSGLIFAKTRIIGTNPCVRPDYWYACMQLCNIKNRHDNFISYICLWLMIPAWQIHGCVNNSEKPQILLPHKSHSAGKVMMTSVFRDTSQHLCQYGGLISVFKI